MTSSRQPDACSYRVDSGLRLVEVDTDWTAFAVANGAPELEPPGCLGRSILSSISGETTAHLYQSIFQQVRSRGTGVSVPIRCDAPALRRFLELAIEPVSSGFEIRSTLVRSEPREPQALLDVDRTDDGTLLRMCSWCKQVDAEGQWLEIEAAVRHLGLFERLQLPRITHSVCHKCFDDVMRLAG